MKQDPFVEAVQRSLCDAAGDRLINLLETLYVNRPSFAGAYNPYEAAVRDGERRLALNLINAARAKRNG